jgi:hypothetical protein
MSTKFDIEVTFPELINNNFLLPENVLRVRVPPRLRNTTHNRKISFSGLVIQITIVLFRTRNLGQHFFDISKKNDVNQSLASLINDNY